MSASCLQEIGKSIKDLAVTMPVTIFKEGA